jgi:hypothetical protein
MGPYQFVTDDFIVSFYITLTVLFYFCYLLGSIN